jgi:class 3 adenylate cyclase/predicted ATPase
VLFCDLVDSTALSALLDPEELREVVRAYHETGAAVIRRYDGHTAQHLGDGLLVYFGYPLAHEDDARRAVRTGVEIIAGLQDLNARLQPSIKARLPHPVQVRIGIHTGLVVIGEIGSTDKREILALGETPNLAARLQALAAPDTVVISEVTHRLIARHFACRSLGQPELKGIATPVDVYQVLQENEEQSRSDSIPAINLTPLIGREGEVSLLRNRWEQVKEGRGQVVLLSGEPGIGKSRLVQGLKDHVAQEGSLRLEARCSPYHQNSAFYPLIDFLQRTLQFRRDETAEAKLAKLEQALALYHLNLSETVPLLASLLSLPVARYPLPALTPQKLKEKTQQAALSWLLAAAEQRPTLSVWEDLQWADPSSLEFLTLLLEQVPTTKLLVVLTYRPEFTPLWAIRSHLTPLSVSRLGRKQIGEMVEKVAADHALPAEVVQQIVSKTDGVPLFVEELTKMVVESGLDVGAHGSVPFSLGIPSTLQDALMARLDRLATVKEVAQLGATLGREFSYNLIHAVSPLDESSLQQALAKLVEAEILYQRDLPPQTRYIFKHALIQDTAYQSLLKSTRQRYHQQIARVLEERFPETKETQPELLAHHYTEASLTEQAIPYWQQAGQRASQHSAFVEAVSHFTKGLALLKTQPDAPERAQQELTLQIALGSSLMTTKGAGAFEVGETYARARELCQRVGETPQLFPVLWGLRAFYQVRGECQTARELGEQMLRLAQSVQDPVLLLGAHYALETSLCFLGEFALARAHVEQGVTLYDPQQHHSYTFVYGGQAPGILCLSNGAYVLWLLGYPDQALKRSYEALALAQGLSHPPSLAFALIGADVLHNFRREGQVAQERAEAAIALANEQGFPFPLTSGFVHRGWALAQQGRAEEGIAQIREGLTASQAIGTEAYRASYLGILTEAYRAAGQPEEGLTVVAEALAVVDKTGERWWEAELYRLKGQLTLQKFQVSGFKFQVQESPKSEVRSPESEAEECFQKAIAVAKKQQARSWELRATMSLARLWQQQGKQHAARNILSEIYDWFTEGFDTTDLKEAKALLEELAH